MAQSWPKSEARSYPDTAATEGAEGYPRGPYWPEIPSSVRLKGRVAAVVDPVDLRLVIGEDSRALDDDTPGR